LRIGIFDGSSMTVREILRLLAQDGWVQTSQRGSHRQLEHATKPGKVTVAGKPSQQLHPKTVKSILRQAGLE
jgi:predicted RNA binding protein YcfA (HicA-like mRNA interferase family)